MCYNVGMRRLTVKEYMKRSADAERKREIEGDSYIARQIEDEQHNNNMLFVYLCIIIFLFATMF